MTQLSKKLLNFPSQEKILNAQGTNDSDNQKSQNIPSNQDSSVAQNLSLREFPKPKENEKKCPIKIHRRSRKVQEGRNYICQCGKSYLSDGALNNHIKIKHQERFIKRPRGRPQKNPKKSEDDFEKNKYQNFFNENGRGPEKEKSFDALPLVQEAFTSIYKSSLSNQLFSKPNTWSDIPVLSNLVSKNDVLDKTKNGKTCDEVFTEYLSNFMNKTNEKYFLFMIKFVLLFRECYDLSENKDKKEHEKKAVTNILSPKNLPVLCNDFYCDFLELNDFFGMNDDEKLEIIEIIQHFCTWLFNNNYTNSKLSLAS